MTTTETPTVDNGVDLEALLGAREALTAAPEAAQFQWRVASTWVNGAHTTNTIEGFSGLGAEQSHPTSFTIDTDHPALFHATDEGATPVEVALVALAGCLSAGIATVASNRGIDLRWVTAHVEGDQDLQGVLGIDPDVRNGFSAIRVRYEIDADASPEDVQALVAQSQKRSAVYDLLTNPTTVTVEVA